MMNSSAVTLVSCYFPLPKSKRSEFLYVQWMTTFLKHVEAPIVVYTCKEWVEAIRGLRGNNLPLIVKESAISDFYMASKKTRFEAHHDLDPEKSIHSVELYMIWNEKTTFLRKTSAENPFNSEYFFWVDIGCFRDESIAPMLKSWPLPEKINAATEGKNKIVLLEIEPFSAEELAWKETSQHDLGPNFEHCVRIGGGVFGGTANAIAQWNDIYYSTLSQFFDQARFAGKDQNIMATIVLKYPQIVSIIKVPSSFTSDRWFFLHYFFADTGYQHNI